MSNVEAVLWDLDGTLVDTEPLWMRQEYAIAAEYGAEWTQTDALNMVGRDLIAAGTYMRERMNLPISPEKVVDRLVAGMVESLSETVPWRSGAQHVLRELAANGIPLALVTMSYLPIANIVADSVGLFSAIVTGDTAQRPKPFADPYEQAAALLDVNPERCIAVEDSATGATAALAAGCRTIVVAGHAPVPHELGHARWGGLEGRGLADFLAVAS